MGIIVGKAETSETLFELECLDGFGMGMFFALCNVVVLMFVAQATSKKVITREEWEKKLNDVKIRKEDMNKLVMNFLVTEGYVDAAEKFQKESGTERILSSFFFFFLSHNSFFLALVFDVAALVISWIL